MKEEREILVKQIFPQIRKICEKRGVTFTEVDLRWGINDEQKAEGKVLSICLEEIERCRPYFIGILGERYGWVPQDIPESLVDQQEWLKERKKSSITALEIVHGVLRNPEMKNNALFYFRSPAYINEIPLDERNDFIEVATEEDIEKFGPAKAKELAEERKGKLKTLKQYLTENSFHVTEYVSPKDIGDVVYNDLIRLINEKYPEDTMPNQHEQETFVHEAFARERTHIYIQDEHFFGQLDKHALSTDKPLVILGESGSGKSALLANWALRYRKKHPEENIFMHFIGASSSSTDWNSMLRRIMAEFKLRFGINQEIPEDKVELRIAFANWLHMASAQGKVILIIDALNQLEDKDGAPDLLWLPPEIPKNLRLFLSTLPGRVWMLSVNVDGRLWKFHFLIMKSVKR